MTQTIAQSPPKPAPRRMSYEEFLKTDFGAQRAEWVNGEGSYMGTVSSLHSDVVTFLLSMIKFWVDARGGGKVRPEPFNMKTGPDLPGRNPDILYVAPEHADRIQSNHLRGPADLVIEVVSPD